MRSAYASSTRYEMPRWYEALPKSPFRQPRTLAVLLLRFRNTSPNVPRPETQWSGLCRLSSEHRPVTCHSAANSARASSTKRCTCSGSNMLPSSRDAAKAGKQGGCHGDLGREFVAQNPGLEPALARWRLVNALTF